MPLLTEYAITPGVFKKPPEDGTFSNFRTLCRCLETGIVRDLCNGEWSKLFSDNAPFTSQCDKFRLRILKSLILNGRIRCVDQLAPPSKSNDHEWCLVAMQSHRQERLDKIITVNDAAKVTKDTEVVALKTMHNDTGFPYSHASHLHNPKAKPKVKKMDDFRSALRLILLCAGNITIIDPYLNPTSQKYHGFDVLLEETESNPNEPEIELHTTSNVGFDHARFTSLEECFTIGLQNLSDDLKRRITVYFWQSFHNRYLLSNLMSLSLPGGFGARNELDLLTRIEDTHAVEVRKFFRYGNNLIDKTMKIG